VPGGDRGPAAALRWSAGDIRSRVVLIAQIAGWQPAARRPLAGHEVLWRAHCAAAGDGPRDAGGTSTKTVPGPALVLTVTNR